MDRQDILAVLKKHIMQLLPDVQESDFKPGIKMADLGANSMDRGDVIIGVMEELHIKCSLLNFAKAKNLEELTDIFFEIVNTHNE